MNIEVIRSELESELTWRVDEIRFLRNQLEDIQGNKRKMQYRRALVLMLYAHYEGFFRFALLRYVRAINDERIKCDEAVAAIVACSWHEIFTAVEMGDRKAKVFARPLPVGDMLHRFARRRDFVEMLPDFKAANVSIPDSSINTESNLWPETLQKNLYYIVSGYSTMYFLATTELSQSCLTIATTSRMEQDVTG